MSEIFIGWSQIDITPLGKVGLIGQFEERISQYVRDNLYATAMAIEKSEYGCSSEQSIMVSTDLIAIYKQLQDELRIRVKKCLPDFNTAKLFVSATHIHTGPYLAVNPAERMSGDLFTFKSKAVDIVTPDEYTKFLLGQLVKLVCDAWQKRKPGGVSWDLNYAAIGHNRNVEYTDGTGAMYGETQCSEFSTLEGPTDSGIELLYTWDKNEELTGIVINIACPAQIVELKYFISADYWGEVRRKVHEKYGEHVTILPLCGAAGDQSPRDLIRKGKSGMDMYEEAGIAEVAKRVMVAIDDKVEAARSRIEWNVVFKHRAIEIDLPILEVTKTEYEQALHEYEEYKEFKKADSEYQDILKVFQVVGIIERYLLQQKNQFYQTEVHGIRLGDIAIVTNPFELFVDYGLRIKARSKANQTFIAQLTGDDAGYLATQRGISHKHYSSIASSCVVGPEGGRLLTNHTVELINSFWE